LPRFGFNVVDVPDIARLHVLAMTTQGVAGERFIGSGDFYWMADIAKMLKQGLGDKAKKVPSIPVRDFAARWRCSIRLCGDGYTSWGSGDQSRRRRPDECWGGRRGPRQRPSSTPRGAFRQAIRSKRNFSKAVS
jgi:nucleoside-diphosphate-sugar epimerase